MSIELFEMCNVFNKLSELTVSKVSVVENNDPVLAELSNIKDFDDRIEFAKKRWDLLGEGSARAVFDINEKLVLKVATNKKGISQNQIEMNPKMQTTCTAKVYAADANGKWILFQATKTIT